MYFYAKCNVDEARVRINFIKVGNWLNDFIATNGKSKLFTMVTLMCIFESRFSFRFYLEVGFGNNMPETRENIQEFSKIPCWNYCTL